jgi:hypothetical protein
MVDKWAGYLRKVWLEIKFPVKFSSEMLLDLKYALKNQISKMWTEPN